MSSRKTERLINLTIALLATKRFLKKSEIFRTIEGYEGNIESQERMFERDKDDLRKIGITIDVGGLDPLFEDEPGYRIRQESYTLDLGALTGEQVALLSLASQAWQGSALGRSAQSALLKLQSLGIDSDFDSLPTMAPAVHIYSPNFAPIAHAIIDKTCISFHYLAADLALQKRSVQPLGIATKYSLWYLVAYDLDRGDLRTFRIDRIAGEVSPVQGPALYTPVDGFKVIDFLQTRLFEPTQRASVQIRQSKGQSLRLRAESIVVGEEFDTCLIPFSDTATFVKLLLWHGDDCIVDAPEHLRSAVVDQLKQLVARHG